MVYRFHWSSTKKGSLVFLYWAFLCPFKNKFGSLNVFTIILPTTNKNPNICTLKLTVRSWAK